MNPYRKADDDKESYVAYMRKRGYCNYCLYSQSSRMIWIIEHPKRNLKEATCRIFDFFNCDDPERHFCIVCENKEKECTCKVEECHFCTKDEMKTFSSTTVVECWGGAKSKGYGAGSHFGDSFIHGYQVFGHPSQMEKK